MKLAQRLSLECRRFVLATAVLAGRFMLDVLLNYYYGRAFGKADQWATFTTIPIFTPKGADLRIFLEASSKMFGGKNPLHSNYNSPPFTALFYYPFTLVDVQSAYAIHGSLVVIANLL